MGTSAQEGKQRKGATAAMPQWLRCSRQLNPAMHSTTCLCCSTAPVLDPPGRPVPQGLSQNGSPGLAAFHSAKSQGCRFSPPSEHSPAKAAAPTAQGFSLPYVWPPALRGEEGRVGRIEWQHWLLACGGCMCRAGCMFPSALRQLHPRATAHGQPTPLVSFPSPPTATARHHT